MDLLCIKNSCCDLEKDAYITFPGTKNNSVVSPKITTNNGKYHLLGCYAVWLL
jgi:hypothetical protein